MRNIKSEASYPCSQAVKALRDFVMSFEEIGAREGEFLCSLSIMEDAFLKLEVKEKRQAKIQEYFRKWPMNSKHYSI